MIASVKPLWRNWETRLTQNQVVATSCWFESGQGHHFIVRRCSRSFAEGRISPTIASIYGTGLFAAVRVNLLVSALFVGISVGLVRVPRTIPTCSTTLGCATPRVAIGRLSSLIAAGFIC